MPGMPAREQSYNSWLTKPIFPQQNSSLGSDGNALQSLPKCAVFGANLLGQALAKFLEEPSGCVQFLNPIVWIHLEQLIDRSTRNIKAIESQRVSGRNVANRCVGCSGTAFDSVENPFQNADVVAVAGP